METLRILSSAAVAVVFAVIAYRLIIKEYVLVGCLFGLGALLVAGQILGA